MKYTHVDHDFSLETVPLGTGAFERILRMNQADVGSLFEFLAPDLYNTPNVRAGKFWFTLANVTCTQSGFSLGYCPPPPKSARPLSSTWLYTFALSGMGYSEDFEPRHVAHRGINNFVWGHRVGQFMTLGTSHTQANEFNLPYNMFAVEQLYYLVGALTKNFILNSKYYTTNPDYLAVYTGVDARMAKSKWYMMPLYTLLRNVAYPRWVYNRHVWSSGQKLLSPKHITVDTLMYLCMFINSIGPLPKAVEDVVVDKFHESLTDMLQRRNSGDAVKEPWQLLYAALVNRGRIPDKYMDFLIEEETKIVPPSGNYNSHILKLIYA